MLFNLPSLRRLHRLCKLTSIQDHAPSRLCEAKDMTHDHQADSEAGKRIQLRYEVALVAPVGSGRGKAELEGC